MRYQLWIQEGAQRTWLGRGLDGTPQRPTVHSWLGNFSELLAHLEIGWYDGWSPPGLRIKDGSLAGVLEPYEQTTLAQVIQMKAAQRELENQDI